MQWAELREEEFHEAVKKSGGVCLIPIGCTEMHGEHLPVGTDAYEAEAIAALAAELEPSVVFPVMKFGNIPWLVNRKGTVRLAPDTMKALLENYCTEIARCGFDKILFVNYHGGNASYLTAFLAELTYKYRDFSALGCFPVPELKTEIYPKILEKGVSFYPELIEEDADVIREYVEENHVAGHGDMMETCLMLAIRPDLVRLDRLGSVDGLPNGKTDRFTKSNANFLGAGPLWAVNFPNSYAATDPLRANARIGKLLLRLAAEKVANAVRIFKEDGHVLSDLMEERKLYYPN